MKKFKKALEYDPLHGEALNNLGVCFYKSGLKEEGIGCFKKILEYNPTDRQAIMNLLDSDISPHEKMQYIQNYLIKHPEDYEMRKAIEKVMR